MPAMPAQAPTRVQRIISEKLEDAGHPPLHQLVETLRTEGVSWRGCAAEITKRTGEPCAEGNLIRWFGSRS